MIDCDVCGNQIGDTNIRIIPVERTVCGDCHDAWTRAAHKVCERFPAIADAIEDFFVIEQIKADYWRGGLA